MSGSGAPPIAAVAPSVFGGKAASIDSATTMSVCDEQSLIASCDEAGDSAETESVNADGTLLSREYGGGITLTSRALLRNTMYFSKGQTSLSSSSHDVSEIFPVSLRS